MKVLHIISSGGMYGAEAVILNLSRILNENGHSSALAVFSNAANPNLQLHHFAEKEGIESHLIPCKGQIDRAVFSAIEDLTAQTGTQVIHAHGYKADIYAFLALRGSRIPLVSTCHNWLDNNLMLSLYGALDRLVLRKYTRVVAVSDEVQQRLLKAGVHKDRIRLIRNGIDLRPFDRALRSAGSDVPGDGDLVVGQIGRLSLEKGVDIFLRAAARVLSQVPNARFVVAGDGPDREKLETLINDLKIGDRVSLLGRQDEVVSVYASLDLMVSPSRQEGLPMAILEGMASGLPLIATAVGQVPSVVLDGKTGVLVPSEDSDRMAQAIVDLLRDPARRSSLGAAARQLVADEFSAQRMMSDYVQVYAEAVESAEKKSARRTL